MSRGLKDLRWSLAAVLPLLALTSPVVFGQASCGSSTGADVIAGEMAGWISYGTIGSISGYICGTTSCNFGNQILPWNGVSTNHPVIGMNAYRLKGGRFEQIGMSWVKHGWAADANNLCCTCINPQNFYALGVGCSDTYNASTNGNQPGFPDNGQGGVLVSGLGPRSDINPYTGAFTLPYTTQGQSGNIIYKRLQININDLDPAQNGGATYFAEGQYVSPNEPAANRFNNVSYKQVLVGGLVNGAYTVSFTGSIQRQLPAIKAWSSADPTVTLVNADVPGEGRFMLGTKVSNNGNGTWHYEYAVYNMNSHRSARSFTVPAAPGVLISNVAFHDVPYHSGEVYSGADWPQIPVPAGAVQWATTDFATDANANALRWGTLYNFRFDANTPPKNAELALGLFRPGKPETLIIPSRGPSHVGDTDGNDTVDVDDLVNIILGWGPCPAAPTPCPSDLDGDGQVDVDDLIIVILHWD